MFCFVCIDALNIFVQGISVVLPIENQMTKPQVLNNDDKNVGDSDNDDGDGGINNLAGVLFVKSSRFAIFSLCFVKRADSFIKDMLGWNGVLNTSMVTIAW